MGSRGPFPRTYKFPVAVVDELRASLSTINQRALRKLERSLRNRSSNGAAQSCRVEEEEELVPWRALSPPLNREFLVRQKKEEVFYVTQYDDPLCLQATTIFLYSLIYWGGCGNVYIRAAHVGVRWTLARKKGNGIWFSKGLCLYESGEQLLRKRGSIWFCQKRDKLSFIVVRLFLPAGASVQFLTQVKNDMYSSLNWMKLCYPCI